MNSIDIINNSCALETHLVNKSCEPNVFTRQCKFGTLFAGGSCQPKTNTSCWMDLKRFNKNDTQSPGHVKRSESPPGSHFMCAAAILSADLSSFL